LQIQYRFPRVLAEFPSKEFYGGRLQTGNDDRQELETRLQRTAFPWPRGPDGLLIPNVFVNCATEEDRGGQSKSNEGQAKLTKQIADLISSVPDGAPAHQDRPEIAVLTPYKKQVGLVRTLVPSDIKISTVDGFQGREADFIIYTSVRSNFSNEIGFLDDRWRLNVAWTRAKYARVLVGDRRTLEGSELWKRAIEDCHEVVLPS
jgi:superfamily I DNA and/or RNA helicase